MTQTSRDISGELIDGRYRILGLIAEGGMGKVYEAEHVDIGRRVALKILSPLLSEMDDVVARFRREARLATQIGNPHIVDVTDSGITEDGRFYFVMEFLDGVELGNLLRNGPLEIGRALRVTRQIAGAVAAAHREGIIHRDLKPENVVLVERDGEPDFVKVLDFGIATTIQPENSTRRLTQPGLAMGTPEYMAPEQAMAFISDERSDIYSLGAILYEMVTGQAPYQGTTFTQVLVQKANADPPPPREIRADLDQDLEALIVKMMARERDDRHQSMDEVAEAITPLLDALTNAENRLFERPPTARASTADPGAGAVAAAAAPASTINSPAASWDQVEQSLIAHADVIIADKLESAAGAAKHEPPAAAANLDQPPVVARRFEPAADAVETPDLRRRSPLVPLLVAGLILAAGYGGYRYWTRSQPSRDDVAAARTETAEPAVSAATPATADVPRPGRKRSPDAPPRAHQDRRNNAATAKSPPAGDDKESSAPAQPTGPAPKTEKQARSLLRKAEAAVDDKRWDQAGSLFGRVAKGRVMDEWGHLGLSRVALASGDAGAAIRHANASLRAGGGLPARLALANALTKKGKLAAAIKQYRIVLRHEPRNREAKRGLQAAQRKRPRK